MYAISPTSHVTLTQMIPSSSSYRAIYRAAGSRGGGNHIHAAAPEQWLRRVMAIFNVRLMLSISFIPPIAPHVNSAHFLSAECVYYPTHFTGLYRWARPV